MVYMEINAIFAGKYSNMKKISCLRLRICLEMIEKLFEVKFLHLLPELSGQIATAIFPESPVESEGFSSQTFR